MMGNSQTLHQMRGVTVEDLRQLGSAGLARLGLWELRPWAVLSDRCPLTQMRSPTARSALPETGRLFIGWRRVPRHP